MPVRKIPKNHLVVTGCYASATTKEMMEFESLLEKEHMLLLDFDPDVEDLEEQPVRIPVLGVPAGYVVDLTIRFRPDSGRSTELVEVKPKSYLEKNAAHYEPKFNAAHRYCEERGWKFVIRTEDDIRTPRLQNLKFLRSFRNRVISEEQRDRIRTLMKAAGGYCSSEGLLNALEAQDREVWLPVIWSMVLTGDLVTDLDDMPVDVPLWIAEAVE